MDVIDQPDIFGVVRDQVVLIVASPDRAFVRLRQAGFAQRLGKGDLDGPPARGAVVIARWQGPDRVGMVRQNDPCVHMEGLARAHQPDRLAERGDMLGQQRAAWIAQPYRKEVRSSRNTIALVLIHQPSLGDETPLPCRFDQMREAAPRRPHQ